MAMGIVLAYNMHVEPQFIAIEGVIGVGKTTLARMLAKRRQARLVLEEFEDNPFLPKFYEDRKRYGFQTQLAFLASRFRQQQNMMSQDLFHTMTVSDYIFEKDRIFARLNLDSDEMALYDSIYSIMTGIAAQADLVVFLQSSVERLMQNIDQRGREYEQHITPEYIRDLNEAYNHFFYHYQRSPVVFINVNDVDFVQTPEHLLYIEEQLFERPIVDNMHIHLS